jgi:hypothetical protein
MEKPDLPQEESVKIYVADTTESDVLKYTDRRIEEMKEYKKNLKLEDKWKEADKECEVGEIMFEKGKKRFESDDELGLRTRLVNIQDERDDWRSKNSDPTLLSKIHTALSILIDKNPESVLTALCKKYEKSSALANSIWKRNWEITNAKDTLKLFVFNLAKYGWAVGRSYPRIIKYKKKVLVQLDQEDRTKDKYEEQEYIRFNDVAKQNMNPYRVWIDETTKPYDRESMKECYYEIDYTKDEFDSEFAAYKNYEFVGDSAKMIYDEEIKTDSKDRKDIITVGFFENRLRDLYVILIPSKKIILHHSPLPNDDGYMSLWHTLWLIQSAESPYGISMWEMIKQDKYLYDKMSNMTMDQLVLSIYKMFFYTGTSGLLGDGQIKIKPGVGHQMVNGDVKWMDVPGPGNEAWEGLKYQKAKIDDNSSIPPVVEGEITGKTLGEILHAKEASLKKLKMPLENIADAIEQDAYLTLSWSSQILSIPEIKTFASEKELMDYESETGVQRSALAEMQGEGGQRELQASYYPEVSLHLEGRGGELFESKESKYFQVGEDIKPEQLKWQGIFKVLPKSILTPSLELEKMRKSEILQTIAPFLGQDPMIFKKSVDQYLKVQEEDPEDWEPDSWLQPQEPLLFVDDPQMLAQQQAMQDMQGGQSGAPRQQPTMNQAVQGTPKQSIMGGMMNKIGSAMGRAFGK